MAFHTSDQTIETLEIDPHGDLYLELKTTRLLVSSKVLSLASSFFARMLRSQFKEGLSNYQGLETPSVALPEDDEALVTLLCQIIHFRCDLWPQKASSVDLYGMAKLCDKYDCVSALRPWALSHMETPSKNMYEVNYAKELLVISYIFDMPDTFSKVSWGLILRYDTQLQKLAGLLQDDLLPDNLMGENPLSYTIQTLTYCS